jgi:hypothetical protein
MKAINKFTQRGGSALVFGSESLPNGIYHDMRMMGRNVQDMSATWKLLQAFSFCLFLKCSFFYKIKSLKYIS